MEGEVSDKKNTSLPGAFKFAFAGIAKTVKTERNFRIELVFAALALLASAFLRLEPVEWALIIILIVLVLAFELINSALEDVIDLASPAIHPLAKHAKDASAAAVMVASLAAAAGGLFLFISAALRLWGT